MKTYLFSWLNHNRWHSLYFQNFCHELISYCHHQLIAGILFWKSYDDMVLQQLEKRGEEISSHIALASANYILTEDVYNLYELISQTASSSEDVRYIIVLIIKAAFWLIPLRTVYRKNYYGM